MSQRGADWYKRDARAFLEGVRRMNAREVAVYAVVLDLIYDGGGRTLNDPKHIASYFGDMGSAAIRRSIEALVDLGKLQIEGEFLTNERAKNQAKTREELKKNRADSGRLGGVSSGKSRSQSNEIKEIPEANASTMRSLEKRREEEDKKATPTASPKKGTRLPENFEPDEEWTKAQGLPGDVVAFEFGKFVDYWSAKSGKDATKVDWQATWRNWIRNVITRSGKGPGPKMQTQGEAIRQAIRERGLFDAPNSAPRPLAIGDGRREDEMSADDLRSAIEANFRRKA